MIIYPSKPAIRILCVTSEKQNLKTIAIKTGFFVLETHLTAKNCRPKPLAL